MAPSGPISQREPLRSSTPSGLAVRPGTRSEVDAEVIGQPGKILRTARHPDQAGIVGCEEAAQVCRGIVCSQRHDDHLCAQQVTWVPAMRLSNPDRADKVPSQRSPHRLSAIARSVQRSCRSRVTKGFPSVSTSATSPMGHPADA
jgi:hypothetical protein